MFDYYHKWQRQVGFKEYQPLEQGNNMTPTKLPEEGNRSIKKPASTEEDQTGPSTEEDKKNDTSSSGAPDKDAVIDKSLDLEKISRRNDSCFSLSSWRIVFSFLFLFSIFKIFRQQISFFSRFARFLKSILFLFSIFKIVKTKVSFYSRFMRLCSLFLFLFL